MGLLDAIRTDRFALLDGGSAVCNLVDVQNLCHAMELALDLGSARPHRLFVTDDSQTVWRDVVAPLARLAEREGLLRDISTDVLTQIRDAERQPAVQGAVRTNRPTSKGGHSLSLEQPELT